VVVLIFVLIFVLGLVLRLVGGDVPLEFDFESFPDFFSLLKKFSALVILDLAVFPLPLF